METQKEITKNNIEEYQTIGDSENSKFISPSINENIFQSKYYKVIIMICLITIIFPYLEFANKEIAANKVNKIMEANISSLLWNNNIETNISKLNEEISSYENINPTFNDTKELYKRKNPKVSLIITVYNQERFVKKIYAVIEQQTLKDIEIVFVDDMSEDNSSKIIEELMEIDKRIVYIKNDKNMGAFYSRNRGILSAKGEYILLVDIDDYILNDILIKAYVTAKTYDLDILQFYVMAGDFKENILWKILKYKSGIIRTNDKVKEVFFKGISRNTWDKFVKREVFVKSIEFMDEKFRQVNYVVYNDDIAMFGLFKVANSYGFLEVVGYIYNWAVQNSTTHKYENNIYMNDIFKSCFTTLQYYYEQTSNNIMEKHTGYNFFYIKIYKVYLNSIKYLTEGFDYVIKIINLYLNSRYIGINEKSKFLEFKNKVLEVMSNNTNITSTNASNI